MILTKEEINNRLMRLKNLENLYAQQKVTILNLREENKNLKAEIVRLNIVIEEQQKTINNMKLQIEELRIMIFGKKKNKDHNDTDNSKPPKEKTPRSHDSYKRPIPKDEEITKTIYHPFNQCSCGSEMTQKKIVIFYEEDIPVPAKKIVIEHKVEKAYCENCKKWHVSIPLPSSKVILGLNIRKYICYLSIICRLSFSQIQKMLIDTYQIHVSEGEIAKILEKEANNLKPLYEQLKIKIRGESVINLDETSWKLFIEKDTSYLWVMSGAESKESVFLVGESRGKGNVEELTGKDYTGVIVTDDYGAYRKLEKHQLCFAHLIRKWRDLAASRELEEKQRIHCEEEYQKLCLIYDDLNNNRTIEKYDYFFNKFIDLSIIQSLDPDKLIRYKTTLSKNISQYLTCLSDSRIPLTNNLAERSLRHLVLKRKISFGSLTKKTADNLAILMSVLLSLKQRYQTNFFKEYLRV